MEDISKSFTRADVQLNTYENTDVLNDQFLVFSIVNEEPNAEEMKSKVKAYEEANRSQIVIRQSQRADEERCTADRCVIVFSIISHMIAGIAHALYCIFQNCRRTKRGRETKEGVCRD